MSSDLPETPPQTLLRSVEAFSRTLRESSLGVARDIGCSKGTLAIVRILQRRGTLQVSDIAHALRVDIWFFPSFRRGGHDLVGPRSLARRVVLLALCNRISTFALSN